MDHPATRADNYSLRFLPSCLRVPFAQTLYVLLLLSEVAIPYWQVPAAGAIISIIILNSRTYRD